MMLLLGEQKLRRQEHLSMGQVNEAREATPGYFSTAQTDGENRHVVPHHIPLGLAIPPRTFSSVWYVPLRAFAWLSVASFTHCREFHNPQIFVHCPQMLGRPKMSLLRTPPV